MLEVARKAKICDLHDDIIILVLLRHAKQVLQLNVSMGDLLADMHVVECEQHLFDDFGCLRFAYLLHFHHFLKHVAASDQLSDDIVVPCVLK